MAHSLMRLAAKRVIDVAPRTFVTSAVNRTEQLSQADKDVIYPRLGNRDIVGFGFNGHPNYVDREEFPCPAIRFKENSPEILKLREKEKGDWRAIPIDDKKALYRASFCQTYSEMKAPTHEWKVVVAGILFGISMAGWMMIFMKTQVYLPPPSTITKEWQEDQVRIMVKQRQGHIDGLASHFDYEKNDWKP